MYVATRYDVSVSNTRRQPSIVPIRFRKGLQVATRRFWCPAPKPKKEPLVRSRSLYDWWNIDDEKTFAFGPVPSCMLGSRREYFDASRVKAKVAADRDRFCLLVLGFAHDAQRSQAPDASCFTRLTGAFHLTVRASITQHSSLSACHAGSPCSPRTCPSPVRANRSCSPRSHVSACRATTEWVSRGSGFIQGGDVSFVLELTFFPYHSTRPLRP
mmetsp:Transcript_8074/g.33779  ORF Transcript_8074/g.33779 Transcript_8074/m.33779 type:complete len:214 (-) Transcript_8074:1928-2569(-)